MPELPEVETVCRGLAKALTGATITHMYQGREDLRVPLPRNLPKRVAGRRILSISRRAKYILINFDDNETLILHLGMSGRMVISAKPLPKQKHDHLIFTFNNGLTVTFNDPRRFGLCDIATTATLDDSKLFQHLGLEPLEKDFTATYLAEKLYGKKVPVKIAIMDQQIVVGVGNIYASEALFYSGIRPTRLAGRVTKDEIAKLVPAIRKVLNAAIKAGGSSLRDYVGAEGELGYFQNQHAVYDRVGKPCKDCTCDVAKTGGVERVVQGGRSSFYCARKQK